MSTFDEQDQVVLRALGRCWPKPHLFKRGELWYCARHFYHDEFFTTWGFTPADAFARCRLLAPVVEHATRQRCARRDDA